MKPFQYRYFGLIFIVLWSCLPHIGAAQDLNDPAIVLKIMDKSDVAYQVMADPTFQAPIPERGERIFPGFYQEMTDDGPSVASYEFDSITEPLHTEAEKLFAAAKYAEARGKYLEIHELRPDIGLVLTYIGQTHEAEQNYSEAVKWYRRAISVNFHDYMAHWFLADDLTKLKRLDEAAKEISIAWVLNRTHEGIQTALIRIFKEAKLKWDGFEFIPQYSLKEKDDKVEIRFQEDWMMYAFCKALWRYEPDYHRELGGGRSEFNIDEEKECLLNLAIGYERVNKGKQGKDVTIDALIRAITEKQINAFIFMEIWLPREPVIAYTQSEGAILELANYVLKVRGRKK